MKYQTNPELGPFINEWGCFFTSGLEKVEKSTGWTKHFSNPNVVGIYQYCMEQTFRYYDGTIKPWISAEEWDGSKPKNGCFIWNLPAVYNYAAEFLGSHYRCTGYKKVDKLYVPKRNEEEILCLGRDGYNGTHFVSGTGVKETPWQGEIEFDPIEGGSQCAKKGFIESKRILTIEVAK